NEVLALARSVVGAEGPAADDVIEEFIDARVIFELHNSGDGIRLRSRAVTGQLPDTYFSLIRNDAIRLRSVSHFLIYSE
ncbi:hypothetical protein ACC688_36555, partial [Rhizobium ruizarguesonis]